MSQNIESVETAIERINSAKTMLASVRDFTEILKIHDQAVAMQAYASARGADDLAMMAVEVKLRSERKAGEFLQEMKNQGILSKGAADKRVDNLSERQKPTLASLGVEQKESQRWQSIASIPEERFEEYLAKSKHRTQAALLNAAESFNPSSVSALPQGSFDIIYADPPWQYDFSLSDRGDPENHYETMTVEKIAELQIPSSENAVLFLWATNPKIQEALFIMEKWGFSYRTNLVWVKDRIGTGYYVRGQHELLLIGVKGDTHPPEEGARPPSVLEAPRREHSQKPDEVYALIERMYPNSKWLELFARQRREGWTSWGGQLVAQ